MTYRFDRSSTSPAPFVHVNLSSPATRSSKRLTGVRAAVSIPPRGALLVRCTTRFTGRLAPILAHRCWKKSRLSSPLPAPIHRDLLQPTTFMARHACHRGGMACLPSGRPAGKPLTALGPGTLITLSLAVHPKQPRPSTRAMETVHHLLGPQNGAETKNMISTGICSAH